MSEAVRTWPTPGARPDVAVSILNADLSNISQTCRDIELAGASSFQVDVMDGHFVPELALGPQVAAAVVMQTRLPVEAHLMVERPERFVDAFAAVGVRDYIFHVEATDDVASLASAVQHVGMRVGVAIKYTTPAERLVPYLPHISLVVVMGVEPGRGGQAFVPACLDIVRLLKREVGAGGLLTRIQIDGGINATTVRDAVSAGADAVVAGSFLFRHADGYAAAIRSLREER